MSAEILRQLHETGDLPIEKLADLLNLTKSSAYRRHSEVHLSYPELRTIIRQSQKYAVVEAFCRDLFGGRGYAIILTDDSDDEDLDSAAAVFAATDANKDLAKYLDELMRAVQDRQITDKELEELNRLSLATIKKLLTAQKAVTCENEQRHKRRKCRPLVLAGGGTVDTDLDAMVRA